VNPILTEIFSGVWLIDGERSAAYASLILSLLKGERISQEDSSLARQRNHPYVISSSGRQTQIQKLSDDSFTGSSTAVIPIRSEILKYDQPCGPRGSQSILQDIKMADKHPDIGSILLIVDSPGGQVTGTDLLADAIRDAEKPVVAYIEGMAASAAYWIISGADKIIASSDLDRIGSIGTMLIAQDLQPALEKLGVKFHEVYASLSTDKNQDYNQVLDGNYDAYRTNVLDVINQKFLSSIKANRSGLNESTLTGKVYFAREAITLGLIDEIGSLTEAIAIANSLAEEKKNKIAINANQKTEMMKIKNTWKAVVSFFKIDPTSLEPQELTDERMEQLDEQMAALSAYNKELELQLQAEKDAHAKTRTDLEALKNEDAASETIARKSADKITGGEQEVVFSHDRIADSFLS